MGPWVFPGAHLCPQVLRLEPRGHHSRKRFQKRVSPAVNMPACMPAV